MGSKSRTTGLGISPLVPHAQPGAARFVAHLLVDGLPLQVVVHGQRALLAADPALLHAAVGGLDEGSVDVVDPDRSGFQSLGGQVAVAHVSAEEVGAETEHSV